MEDKTGVTPSTHGGPFTHSSLASTSMTNLLWEVKLLHLVNCLVILTSIPEFGPELLHWLIDFGETIQLIWTLVGWSRDRMLLLIFLTPEE